MYPKLEFFSPVVQVIPVQRGIVHVALCGLGFGFQTVGHPSSWCGAAGRGSAFLSIQCCRRITDCRIRHLLRLFSPLSNGVAPSFVLRVLCLGEAERNGQTQIWSGPGEGDMLAPSFTGRLPFSLCCPYPMAQPVTLGPALTELMIPGVSSGSRFLPWLPSSV